ncbi:MAG: hypothetical protein N2596_04005, partial [Syntrophorhabdaceae bacterium]|nr:hypothetical protein [Syntrophorhabdaceae bacterium]
MIDDMHTFLNEIENFFTFTVKDAREMMEHFHKEMEKGLRGEESSLKMLPSFVKRPKGIEKGTFLAIDLGGTNLRVLAVRLLGNGKIEQLGMKRFSLTREVTSDVGDVFFDFIALCVADFLDEHHLETSFELGFTFSFPVVQTSISKGILVSWTKGFSVKGVEGRDVVGLLDKAFKRKGLKSLKVVALLNDTVSTLAAKRYVDPKCDMGVILGTGTNAAYPEKINNITKYKGKWDSDEMIINIEWGGFDKIKENIYDRTLDRNSENSGKQKMEKMVSGMYIGEIARIILWDAYKSGFLNSSGMDKIFFKPYSLTTEQLSLFVSEGDLFKKMEAWRFSHRDIGLLKEIGRIVSKRAARIAATAIAAVLT